MTHKSVRGHAINAQKHYLPYEMFLNRTFSLAPYMICMQFVLDFLFFYFFWGGKVESKLSKFISCHMGLFCCYFGGTKRKGRFTFRLSWIKMQESTIPEIVIISFHNPGAKSKWHRPELNQPSLKSGWSRS